MLLRSLLNFWGDKCERSRVSKEKNLSTVSDVVEILFETLEETNTAGKISIEHVTIFPSKYVSKSAVDMTFHQMQ